MRTTTGSADTPWRRGRFDERVGPKRVLFGRMYEDPTVERTVFRPGGKIFCIASAGCTALALCDRHDQIVACDINPTQLAYAERRIRSLTPSIDAREEGSAEQVMRLARVFMPLVGWTRAKLVEFLALSDPDAQVRFWKERLDTWRFRFGFGALMSLSALSAVYSSELLRCLPKRFGRVLRARMERTFSRHANVDNPYLRALFMGDDRGALADSSRSLPREKDRAKIELVLGDAASYLENVEPRTFDGLTFSNILDGAGASYRERLTKAIQHAATPDAVVVTRSFSEPPVTKSESGDDDNANNVAALDRSMLWGIVDVRRARDL